MVLTKGDMGSVLKGKKTIRLLSAEWHNFLRA